MLAVINIRRSKKLQIMKISSWLIKKILLVICLCIGSVSLAQRVDNKQNKRADAELLGKALDYFSSQKYHESLLLLQDLDKKYRLNPRYKAYLGVCYYYEWDYEKAVKNLSIAIPQLINFSPQERSFYYWAEGESYFNLQAYQKAIPSYLSMLPLCHANEKADAYYRLGFCYMFLEDWGNAWVYFRQASKEYTEHRDEEEVKVRLRQISNMLKGIEPKVAMQISKNMHLFNRP